MTTNLLSDTTAPQDTSPGLRGLILAVFTALALSVRKHLKRKGEAKADLVTRAEFLTELREMGDRRHADHLDLLQELGRNHRELLTTLERHGDRISGLEAAFARLDERSAR